MANGLAWTAAGGDFVASPSACLDVGTFGFVARSNRDRIASVLKVQKVNALNDTSGVNIEAWNNSLSKHLELSILNEYLIGRT